MIFPLVSYCLIMAFCRWAETCSLMNFSLSFEDCCDRRYCPYLCMPLLCVRVFIYTHMFTYAYWYIRVSVHECRPTFAYVYELVCARLLCLYMFPEFQWCLNKYIHMCMWHPATWFVTVSGTYVRVTYTATFAVMLWNNIEEIPLSATFKTRN
jgi:hypothetical protein